MANYEYVGQLPSGSALTGTFEASSPGEARQELDELAIHVTSLTEAPRLPASRPLSREDLLFFNQQLASLAETGIALDQGLRVLAHDLQRGRLRQVVEALAGDLERGTPFEQAVEKRSGLFPPLYAEVLKSGVQNSRLGSTLFNLNAHFSLMESARRMFREAAVYPAVVLSLGFALIWFFMRVVVPQFEEVLIDASGAGPVWNETNLPGITVFFLDCSRHWNTIALAILGVALALLIGSRLLRTFAVGRGLGESLLSLLPGIGPVHQASLVARFAQAAALGAKAGQDLPTVLRLAAGATGSTRLTADADRLARHIEAGGLPVEAPAATRVLPALFAYVSQVAGTRGQLAAALADMAQNYHELARRRLGMLRMFLLPLSVVATAVILGTGVMAMYMPLINMLNSLTGGY